MNPADIHACTYQCERPARIRRQRDELYTAILLQEPGFTAADMADQYATAFERGRESVLAEQAAAAQEAVAYLDIGAGGYLDIGSDLPEEQLLALPNGRHALGIIGTFGIDGYVAAPVAAAPGIDLEQFRKLSRDMRKFIDNWDTISIDEFAHFSTRLDEMIDASPKGERVSNSDELAFAAAHEMEED